ncbi:hypothetical protein SPB21_22545 [Leptothoe sp. ISB3NOV94-8A]
MVLAYQVPQKRPVSVPVSEPPAVLTAALDSGYSLAQLWGSVIRVNEPSYFISEGLPALPDEPEQGVFSYVSGDANELVGRTFAVGSIAHSIDSGKCQKNADALENKINSALIMLLGLLTYQKGLPRSVKLNLLPCLQKVTPRLREQMAEVLQGKHLIKYGRRSLHLDVNVLGCADEGIGVIAVTPNCDPAQNIVVVSVGGGTINVSQFFRGKLLTQTPFPSGVMELYNDLALSNGVTGRLKASGDPHIIREGVERGDLFYGGPVAANRFSFGEDYLRCLPRWFKASFARPMQHANEMMLKAERGLVFGGGAMLPGISKLLETFNFEVVGDPVNANVHGLYEIAKSMVARQEGRRG